MQRTTLLVWIVTPALASAARGGAVQDAFQQIRPTLAAIDDAIPDAPSTPDWLADLPTTIDASLTTAEALDRAELWVGAGAGGA